VKNVLASGSFGGSGSDTSRSVIVESETLSPIARSWDCRLSSSAWREESDDSMATRLSVSSAVASSEVNRSTDA
jgi:hypothetical protein